MYRTIDSSVWNDPRIRKLDTTSKLLAFYLITNDRSHVTGLYFFSLALASDELNIDITKIRKSFKLLCEVNFCQWDEERRVVWVRNMWKRQPHANVHYARVENYFLTLNGTPLVPLFLKYYPAVKLPGTKLSQKWHNPVTDLSLQEQEIEQKQEIEQEIVTPSPPAQAPKKDQVVEIKSQLTEYATKYPQIDVTKEYEKWQDWMAAKGKTFRNYHAAFRNWLRNAEEFRRQKAPDTPEEPSLVVEDPVWDEIKALRSYDFQVLRQEAMPYARKESQCGDKRSPPEDIVRKFMIKLHKIGRRRNDQRRTE